MKIRMHSEKYAVSPRPSVSRPSSRICRNLSRIRGCAFSISSNSTTRERLLAHRVGQLAAGLVADVARRRPDQPLAGVLGGELAHVEPHVRRSSPNTSYATVLASSVLPTPVGPAKNSTPRGRLTLPRLRPGQAHRRPLEDVEGLGDRRPLAAHAFLDERQRVGDPFAQIVFLPRIFGGADLEALHRIVDVAKADGLAVGELRDVHHCDQRQAVGALREFLRELARAPRRRPHRSRRTGCQGGCAAARRVS